MKVDVTLSKSGEGAAIVYDLHYTNDNYGGNRNETTFEMVNDNGNTPVIEMAHYAKNLQTGHTELVWERPLTTSGIRITIQGEWENKDFLSMLQLILQAEKMAEIIKS